MDDRLFDQWTQYFASLTSRRVADTTTRSGAPEDVAAGMGSQAPAIRQRGEPSMDADRFDTIIRSLSAGANRRGIARALGGLALTGGVSALLGRTDAAAKKKKGKGKKKKKCKGGTKKCGKKCIAATSCCSAADCGSGGACASGACTCATGFRACQGSCIPDDACCDADCGPCESCQGATCVFACQAEQECVSGQCQCTTSSCDGCCDGDTCRSGISTDFCGSNGETCNACTGNATCQNGNCVCPTECCSHGDCGTGDICAQGQCVTGQGTCPTGEDACAGDATTCNGTFCSCRTSTTGQTRCARFNYVGCNVCDSDTDCAVLHPGVPGVFCGVDTGSYCQCSGFCAEPC